MKLAFSIIAHKHPLQVVDLVSSIAGPDAYIAIHCDKKSGTDFQTQIESELRARDIPNVAFIERQNVEWGGWSCAKANLDAIKTLLQMADDWRFFINLSGQCLPTKSKSELKEFLSTSTDRNFMQCLDPLTDWTVASYRLKRYFANISGVIQSTKIPRLLPRTFKVYGGSAWLMINRTFAEHVMESPEAARLKKYFRYVDVPDEMLFQTILMNGPYRNSLRTDFRRHIVWPTERSPNPRFLTASDLPDLMQGDHFFARKFDCESDPEVIEKLLQRSRLH